MNEAQVYDKVVQLIGPYVKDQACLNVINNNTRILEDLEVNSARLVDIVLSFEDEFDIEVDDEAADNILTIGDAVSLINAKIQ